MCVCPFFTLRRSGNYLQSVYIYADCTCRDRNGLLLYPYIWESVCLLFDLPPVLLVYMWSAERLMKAAGFLPDPTARIAWLSTGRRLTPSLKANGSHLLPLGDVDGASRWRWRAFIFVWVSLQTQWLSIPSIPQDLQSGEIQIKHILQK